MLCSLYSINNSFKGYHSKNFQNTFRDEELFNEEKDSSEGYEAYDNDDLPVNFYKPSIIDYDYRLIYDIPERPVDDFFEGRK